MQAINEVMLDFSRLQAANDFISAEALLTVLDSITDGFFFLDKDWKILYWNRSAETITLQKRESLLNRCIWDIYPTAINTTFFTEYHKAVTENKPVEFVAHYNALDVWLEVRAFPSAHGLAVYLKDISAKKKQELEIELQRAQQEAIINATTSMVWSVDKELRLTLMNNTFKQVVFASSGNALQIGESVFNRHTAEEEKLWRPYYEAALAGKCMQFEFSYNIQQEQFWVDINFSPVYNAAQQILGVACFSRDITPYKKMVEAELQKRKSEEVLSVLLDKGADMVGIIDTNANYKYISGNVGRIMGYDAKQLVGSNALSYIHPDDIERVQQELTEAAQCHEVTVKDIHFKDAWNNWRCLEVICTNMLNNEAVEGFVVNSRDITERKKAEEQLLEAFEKLKQQNEILRQISFTQSHEVRKPLANLLGLIQLLKTGDATADDIKLYIEMIETCGKELDSIIKKIIDKSNAVNSSSTYI